LEPLENCDGVHRAGDLDGLHGIERAQSDPGNGKEHQGRGDHGRGGGGDRRRTGDRSEITKSSVERLTLQNGDAVSVIMKATEVMLGK
jgi:hypothetical protein